MFCEQQKWNNDTILFLLPGTATLRYETITHVASARAQTTNMLARRVAHTCLKVAVDDGFFQPFHVVSCETFHVWKMEENECRALHLFFFFFFFKKTNLEFGLYASAACAVKKTSIVPHMQ